MSIVRKSLLIFVASLAVLFLLAAALDSGVLRVVGSPEPIKRTLADSGIYDSIIPSTLDDIDSDIASSNEVPFGNKIVVKAAEATFSGRYLQANADGVIDSVYLWLDGQGTAPDFKIDLTAKKREFANLVADGVKQHVEALPVCVNLSTAEFDAFSAKCRPAAVSASQAAAEVRRDILNSQEFLEDPVITAADIKSANSDQPFFSGQLKDAPAAYQRFKASPLVLFIVAAVMLVGVFLLSQSRLKGLKHVGFILAGCGIFVLLLSLAVGQTVNNKVLSQIKLDNTVLQHDLRQLVGDISQRTTNTLLAFGGVYTALGAAMSGGYYYLRRRRAPKAAKR